MLEKLNTLKRSNFQLPCLLWGMGFLFTGKFRVRVQETRGEASSRNPIFGRKIGTCGKESPPNLPCLHGVTGGLWLDGKSNILASGKGKLVSLQSSSRLKHRNTLKRSSFQLPCLLWGMGFIYCKISCACTGIKGERLPLLNPFLAERLERVEKKRPPTFPVCMG